MQVSPQFSAKILVDTRLGIISRAYPYSCIQAAVESRNWRISQGAQLRALGTHHMHALGLGVHLVDTMFRPLALCRPCRGIWQWRCFDIAFAQWQG